MNSIGEKISESLVRLEAVLIEYEVEIGDQPKLTKDGFRAAIKIFMVAVSDKIWDLQENEDMDILTRIAMAETVGHEIRDLVKIYTNIDTTKLYGTPEQP